MLRHATVPKRDGTTVLLMLDGATMLTLATLDNTGDASSVVAVPNVPINLGYEWRRVRAGGGPVYNPHLEVWDTTGLGASDSFGTGFGSASYIEQQVSLVNGVTYEFRCDASSSRSTLTQANLYGGTLWVEVNNVQIAFHSFGSIVVGQIMRAQLCGRFSPNTTGQMNLRISIQGISAGPSTMPLVNIDNVSVKDVVGPTCWFNGNRRIGNNLAFVVRGDANAAYASFIALGIRQPGVPIPGVNGLLTLNSTAVTMALGTLDGTGTTTNVMAIPNYNSLLTRPLWFQAGMASGGTVSLGYDFGVVFAY
jgi:hypothetical protein